MTDEPKITIEECRELFGAQMPLAACELLFSSPPEKPVSEIRAELRAIAKKISGPRPMTMREALECALAEFEDHNGRIIDEKDPHWSVQARRILRWTPSASPKNTVGSDQCASGPQSGWE